MKRSEGRIILENEINKISAFDQHCGVCAVLGGSLGALIGMRFFHHKTKHWYFVIGIPAILVLQIIGCVLITNYF